MEHSFEESHEANHSSVFQCRKKKQRNATHFALSFFENVKIWPICCLAYKYGKSQFQFQFQFHIFQFQDTFEGQKLLRASVILDRL